jgi:hypothetical protein
VPFLTEESRRIDVKGTRRGRFQGHPDDSVQDPERAQL